MRNGEFIGESNQKILKISVSILRNQTMNRNSVHTYVYKAGI